MKYVVTGVWLATIALGLLPLLGWNRYVYEVMRRGTRVYVTLLTVRDTCSPALWISSLWTCPV